MSSVIPDTVSPSLFIFSAAISACFTSSISSQVRSLYSDGRPFWRKSFITSPIMSYFSPALSPQYNSSKLICAISAPPLQYITVPQRFAKVQRKSACLLILLRYSLSYLFKNLVFFHKVKRMSNSRRHISIFFKHINSI